MYIFFGAMVACQWPHPDCFCWKTPASDRINGRYCSLSWSNLLLATVWILLAVLVAVSRSISRLAVCLAFLLAHALVLLYLRYKVTHVGDSQDDLPGNYFVEANTRSWRLNRIPSRRVSPVPRLPVADRPQLSPSPPTCAVGIPCYGLPVLYALVGPPCPVGCACPYCRAGGIPAPSPCDEGTTRVVALISPSPSRESLAQAPALSPPSPLLEDLSLPGALHLVGAAPSTEVRSGGGNLAGDGEDARTTRARAADHGALVGSQVGAVVAATTTGIWQDQAPLPPPPSLTPQLRSANRQQPPAEPPAGQSRRRIQPVAAAVIGVPAPPGEVLAEGVPAAELIIWQRVGGAYPGGQWLSYPRPQLWEGDSFGLPGRRQRT